MQEEFNVLSESRKDDITLSPSSTKKKKKISSFPTGRPCLSLCFATMEAVACSFVEDQHIIETERESQQSR